MTTESGPFATPAAVVPGAGRMEANLRRHFLVGTLTLAAVVGTVLASLESGRYFFYSLLDRTQWRHPTLDVAVFCLLVLVEGAFLAAALKTGPGTRPWLRRLLASVLFAPWALASTMVIVHAPGYVIAHTLWTWAVELLLIVMFLAAVLWRPRRP